MKTILQSNSCCKKGNCPSLGATSGIALLLIGLLILAGNFIRAGWLNTLLTPALSLVLLGWGIYCHRMGLLIPGGILSGASLGGILLRGPLSQASPEIMGGVFLLSLAGGFILITALALAFLRCKCWWTLVVAALLGLAGVNLLMGNPAALPGLRLGQFWPLLLVGVGIYLILRQWRSHQA